jgi:hypothetical protein
LPPGRARLSSGVPTRGTAQNSQEKRRRWRRRPTLRKEKPTTTSSRM